LGAVLADDESVFNPVPEMILNKPLSDNKPAFYANFIQGGDLNFLQWHVCQRKKIEYGQVGPLL
jgi:hypothetical protein